MLWTIIDVLILLILLLLGPKNGLQSLTVKIFNFMWCGGLAASNLGLYELYVPSGNTNILFIIAIIVFNIVYNIVWEKSHRINSVFEANISLDNTSIKLGALFFANILMLIICLPYIPKAWSIYQLHGLTYLRGLVYTQTTEYFSNVYISLLFQWLIQPFFQFVLLLAASQVNDFQNNKRLFIIAIFNLTIEMLLFGGGRRTIVMFLLQMSIFYLIKNPIHFSRFINVSLKKIGIIAGAIVMIVIIIDITALRLTRISVFESLFQYYVGPYIFFDRITNGSTWCDFFSNFTYGTCMLSFLIVPFNIFKMAFGLGYKNTSSQVLNGNLDKIVSIGNHSVHNAHATSLIYFCSDFGFYFSFLGMIFFAIILAYFTKRYRKNNRYLILAVYFASLTFYSAQTYPFTGVIQYILIFFTILFVKK